MSNSSTSYYDDFLSKISSQAPWPADKERAILEPFVHITSTPGKEIRTRLIDAFNVWLRVPEEDLAVIRRVVNKLHSASLLMDDVEDDSELRRGIPVAHKIYGVPQTINTANYVYFQAFQELFLLRPQSSATAAGEPLDRIVNDELLNLHRGQGMDLFWRDNLICPTEEEYIEMVNNKTGGLFRLAVKLMMAKSSSTVDYVPLVNIIGVLFQIRDDYMNLQSTEYSHNKGFAEDLTEGKFSFPIVHGIRADPSNRQILNVLKQRPTSDDLKRYIIGYLREKTGSFEYTIEVMDKLRRQALEEVRGLGGNEALERILGALEVKREEGESGR